MELLAGVGPREVEACQAVEERKVGPRGYLVERPKSLGWGQGGVGWSWRRGRRFVGAGL